MTAITYIARRKVASDHTVGTEYTIDVDMTRIDPADIPDREDSVSKGGRKEIVFNRLDTEWAFTTAPLSTLTTDAAHMREFLASAQDGQTLTIDPYGTSGTPDNPLSCILASKESEPTRRGPARQVFTFRVSEQ